MHAHRESHAPSLTSVFTCNHRDNEEACIRTVCLESNTFIFHNDLPETMDAVLLHGEAELYIQSLEKMSLREIGSPKYVA